MTVNPYKPTEIESRQRADSAESVEEPEPPTTGLAVLCVIVILQVLISVGLLGVCLLGGAVEGAVGATVSLVYDVVILVGLLRKQEWARLNLIFMNCMTIGFVLLWAMSVVWIGIPLIAINLFSAIWASTPAVKRVTKQHSMAKTYTYGESRAED